jgi:SAM-dependent methyltransferase
MAVERDQEWNGVEGAAVTKGWFKVPNIRPHGDRTIKEQMLGLDRALAEAKGKRVLDLGCAEGCISAAFARAGAAEVVGIELLESHLEVARQVCKGLPVRFICKHLSNWIELNPDPEQFDIVLALGIIHKIANPNEPMIWAARSAKDLLCFRAPAKTERWGADYYVKSKFGDTQCNVPKTMREQGFVDEGTVAGVRGEGVQYFRRLP